jgi:hypothetical protein
LTGNCHRGAVCTFSHNLGDYPCKYLHATGTCDKGNLNCKFSHKLLETPEEINRFIDDNEQFLADLFKRDGKTNLGDYYTRRIREKEEASNKKQLSNLMIPPSLLGN